MRLSFFQKIILMSIVCVSTATCASLEKAQMHSSSTKQQMKNTQKEINQIIDVAKCTDSKQCKSLAIGAKACGGPQSYQIYSTLKTDVEKLITLGEQLKLLNKRYIKEEGLMSDCMMVMPPAVACLNNRCQLSQ